MTLEEHISRQRVKYIVSSYQLEGDDPAVFNPALDQLLQTYAAPILELALAETLVELWLTVPLPRGLDFLQRAEDRLQQWVRSGVCSRLDPDQFQLVTGLDPTPVFQTLDFPPPTILGRR